MTRIILISGNIKSTRIVTFNDFIDKNLLANMKESKYLQSLIRNQSLVAFTFPLYFGLLMISLLFL